MYFPVLSVVKSHFCIDMTTENRIIPTTNREPAIISAIFVVFLITLPPLESNF